MSRCRLLMAAALVVAALLATSGIPAHAWTLPFWMKVEKVLDSTAELSQVAQSPRGEFWLLERTTGKVRVTFAGVDKASLVLPVTTTCQSGLLGLAFPPDHNQSGEAFVYFVDNLNHARVNRIVLNGSTLSDAGTILDLGVVSDNCRPGGGLALGKDGKLFVASGDFGFSGNAQNDASLLGKVLRMELDGSVPADNPTPGSLVFAKGFRNGRGLAVNPTTPLASGTLYGSERGAASPAAADETNAIRSSGNYAWDICSGTCSGYDNPLMSAPSTALIDPVGVASMYDTGLAGYEDVLLLAAENDGDAQKKGRVRLLPLAGANLDTMAGTGSVLYNPRGDFDGTYETTCPTKVNSVARGNDGWAYLGNGGSAATNTGVWRVYHDAAGPREVSAPGSPFPLQVQSAAGGQVKVVWENLGSLDAGKAKRTHASARNEAYRIWEGDLNTLAGGSFNIAAKLSTNGTSEGLGRLSATISPNSGNRFFLVAAQNDNYEGALGRASNGAPRAYPAGTTTDYCSLMGFGNQVGQCIRQFHNPEGYVDYNPYSPTYHQRIKLSDFRGKVYKLALTSENCGWCEEEAKEEDINDKKFRDNDFTFIGVFTLTYSSWNVCPPSQCEAKITAWANSFNTKTPIVCDEDQDGNGKGDFTERLDRDGGAPQNFYVDQGGVLYQYEYGAQFAADVRVAVINEINAEGCD